jgi:hypothetical protein
MIYQELNLSSFRSAFHHMGRGEQFSYEALGALYEMLEDMGCDYELDVIGLCCEFTQYKSLNEFRAAYSGEYSCWDDVADETLVLQLDDGGAVVQDF